MTWLRRCPCGVVDWCIPRTLLRGSWTRSLVKRNSSLRQQVMFITRKHNAMKYTDIVIVYRCMQFLITTNRIRCCHWETAAKSREKHLGFIRLARLFLSHKHFPASRSPSSVLCEEKQKNLYSCRTITNSTSTLYSTANHRTHHLIPQSCKKSKNKTKA